MQTAHFIFGIFKYNRDNPDSRLTRQSDMFHIARCPLKFAQNLPLYTLPEIWNKQARSFTDVIYLVLDSSIKRKTNFLIHTKAM